MLERVRTEPDSATGIANAGHYELSDIIAFLRSYWPLVAASALACVRLGVVYILTTKPTFTATAQILIEANQHATPTLANTESLMAMDTPQIESEAALLQSEQIARKVAQLLEQRGGDAEEDTTTSAKKGSAELAEQSFLTWFYQLLFGAPKPETDDEKEARLKAVIAKIQGNMDVRRVGLSYVLNVSYRAGDRKTAANVANAIGDAYVQDKLDVRAQSARQGGAWLEARIEELRRSMNDAALDVQVFKAKRDYRLFDKPHDGGGETDNLPSFGPNPQTAIPSGAQANAREPNDKASDVAPEHTTLDELESRAETYKRIYESYLQAYMETVQRQSYPGTNARVITRAEPPRYKSAPKRLLILAGSLVLGTFLGLGLSLVHFGFDKTVRSPRQVERNLEMPFLGEVAHTNFFNSFTSFTPANLIPRRLRPKKAKQLASSFFIVENKRSPHTARQLSATAIALKKAMDTQGTHVVGLLGIAQDLNAAAVSSNLALLNARAGWRTLLIEADTESPNLKSFFASDAAHGLQGVLSGSIAVANAVMAWPNCPKLSLLLAKSSNSDLFPDQISHLKTLIEQAANQYDVILVHLPHANSTNQVLAAVSNVVIVAKAGQTVMPELIDITASLRLAGKQPLGVILSDLV